MQDPNQPQTQPYPDQPQPITPNTPQYGADPNVAAQQPFPAQQPEPQPQVQPQQQYPPQQPVSPFFASQPTQPFQPAQPQQPFGEAPQQPAGPTPPPPSSKKKLIIIVAIVAALLIGGGVAAFLLLSNKAPAGLSAGQASENTTEEVSSDQKQTITASNISDFSGVCENKIISNAAESNKPYKLLPFFKTGDVWGIYALADERLSADPIEINAVACISLDASTEKLVQSDCEATNISTRSKLKVDAYSATYKVDFYAPSTGEKISSTTVTPASQSCPSFANAEGKYYIMPLESDLKPVLDAFLS